MVVAWANAGARPDARMAAIPPVLAATAPPPDSFKKLRRLTRAMAFLPLGFSLAEITRMQGWSNISPSGPVLPGQTKAGAEAPAAPAVGLTGRGSRRSSRRVRPFCAMIFDKPPRNGPEPAALSRRDHHELEMDDAGRRGGKSRRR